MATQKQRRRRAKEKRHDYDLVYVDEDGVEQPVEREEPRKPTAQGQQGPRGRARRRSPAAPRGRPRKVAQPPSWRQGLQARRHLRAGLLRHRDPAQRQGVTLSSARSAIFQTVLLIAVFIPFSYFMDRVVWRQQQKRLGRGRLGGRGASRGRPARARADRNEHVRRQVAGRTRRRRSSSTRAVTPATIRQRARCSGAPRCAAILVTHGHFDHIVSLADLAEATGAPVYAPAGERILIEEPVDVLATGARRSGGTSADVWLEGGETVDVAGISFAVTSVPGHSPGAPRLLRAGDLFSGDVLFAGSVGRTDLPGGDWGVLLASIASLLDAYPPETVVHPGHGPETTLGAELAAEPVPRRPARRAERRERQDRAPARHARRRPVRDARLAARHGRGRAALRALRLPQGPDARLRGHGALRAHLRPGLGRRAEGDVQLHRPLRPLAHAAAGGDGADLPRLRRARHAPRAAAREDVHDRADVPLRRAGQGPLPRALAGVRRGDRLGRPVDRRRADPALRHAAPPARRHRVPPRAQLDRVSQLPSGLPRAAAGVARRATSSASTATRGPRWRRAPCACSTTTSRSPRRCGRRSTRRRRSATRSARSASRTSPPSGPISTPRASPTRSSRPSCAGSTTTRGRPGSSSGRWTTRTRRSRAAAATTASWRRSAGRRRPGVGFGAGLERLIIAMEDAGVDRRAAAASTPSSCSSRARRGRRWHGGSRSCAPQASPSTPTMPAAPSRAS